MKKIVLTCIAGLAILCSSQAQTNASDDANKVSIKPYLVDQVEMPADAKKLLATKLAQIITENGISGGKNQRFVITANVSTLSKDMTATAPPMVALNININLYIGDGIEGKLFASTSVPAKGVGTNENKAYIEAIKTLRGSNAEIQSFVTRAKSKIIEYYNTNCDQIIRLAETKATQGNFEEAISDLMSVPSECKECYDKCIVKVGPIFDKQQAKLLNDAKTVWAASQNAEGAAKVASMLQQIAPGSPSFTDALAFREVIAKKIQEFEKRDWDFKMKQYDDAVSLEKQRIDAYKAVGVAYGNGQPETVYKVDQWIK